MQIGDVFTQEFRVTDEIYTGFINLFQDKNNMHTNENHARKKGFEGRVMHGNILNGFLSFFIGECLPVKDVIIHAQEIQFKNPVYLNDEVLLEAKIIGIYESVNAVEFKYSFRNEQGKIVAKGKFQIGLI